MSTTYQATLDGAYTIGLPSIPLGYKTFICMIKAGPLPTALTTVYAAIQHLNPAGLWTESGGLSARGSGNIAASTSYIGGAAGDQFQCRVSIVNGPVPITITTTAG